MTRLGNHIDTRALPEHLPEWEALAIDAVGRVIEYWGFDGNEGRIWALLYLNARPFSSEEIERALGFSRDEVTKGTQELEAWKVLHRPDGCVCGAYVAQTDLMAMIRNVITVRESRFVARIRTDLEKAELAARHHAPKELAERIAKMRGLAQWFDRAICAFLRTTAWTSKLPF